VNGKTGAIMKIGTRVLLLFLIFSLGVHVTLKSANDMRESPSFAQTNMRILSVSVVATGRGGKV
jgi:hypothetical protein